MNYSNNGLHVERVRRGNGSMVASVIILTAIIGIALTYGGLLALTLTVHK